MGKRMAAVALQPRVGPVVPAVVTGVNPKGVFGARIRSARGGPDDAAANRAWMWANRLPRDAAGAQTRKRRGLSTSGGNRDAPSRSLKNACTPPGSPCIRFQRPKRPLRLHQHIARR